MSIMNEGVMEVSEQARHILVEENGLKLCFALWRNRFTASCGSNFHARIRSCERMNF